MPLCREVAKCTPLPPHVAAFAFFTQDCENKEAQFANFSEILLCFNTLRQPVEKSGVHGSPSCNELIIVFISCSPPSNGENSAFTHSFQHSTASVLALETVRRLYAVDKSGF